MSSQQQKGVTFEVLGSCTTNTTEGSTHDATVEYRHLWSYAQEAALIAVSEKSASDGCYRLVADPERRAKRIAAHYADLYFLSAEKSDKQVQFYWMALAAFVVKDIVEAFRFAREEVLHKDWNGMASAVRNSTVAALGSLAMTDDSPYQHALRTYAALAKGNLWLFMDIYPPLWFFLEYGINPDGTLNERRLRKCLPERDWNTFQVASKKAVEELPFGPNWLKRLQSRLSNDVVYTHAKVYFQTTPAWSAGSGYGQHYAAAFQAHSYCRANTTKHDDGYRTPPGSYWAKFREAFFVMESEHKELSRIAADGKATDVLVRLRNFHATDGVKDAYSAMIKEYSSPADKSRYQREELFSIAKHEQLDVLQPLIYDDEKLKSTMDLNHNFSRLTLGWISPPFKVIYSADPNTPDPSLETVFDTPDGRIDRAFGPRKSLPDQNDRMAYVKQIAADFDKHMTVKRSYMETQLRKIREWKSA